MTGTPKLGGRKPSVAENWSEADFRCDPGTGSVLRKPDPDGSVHAIVVLRERSICLKRSCDFRRWEPFARLTNSTGRLFHGDTNGFSGTAEFFQREPLEPAPVWAISSFRVSRFETPERKRPRSLLRRPGLVPTHLGIQGVQVSLMGETHQRRIGFEVVLHGALDRRRPRA